MQIKSDRYYTHLVFDLYGARPDVLESVERGFQVLAEVCTQAGLTPVERYHTEYTNNGYSCGLLLSESHISLHTWPEKSYCAVDIFMCGGDEKVAENVLLNQLRVRSFQKTVLVRGKRGELNRNEWIRSGKRSDYYESYLASRVLVCRQSPYQLIEIFETPSAARVLMLDKDIQISTSDEHIYHEHLVHPPLLAHRTPKDVLIIGGGDGGALREVVKYDSVERIVLLDIDSAVIEESKELLPGVNRGAFGDSRVRFIFGDAADSLGEQGKFDVVLIDLTAPAGPSVAAYEKLAEQLGAALAEGAFVGLHSGWWASDRLVDYPSRILKQFSNVLLHNRWIDSFACFWSFLVAWDHEQTSEEVMRAITARSPLVKTDSFDTSRYLQEVFVRNSHRIRGLST